MIDPEGQRYGVLITRPEPGATATSRLVHALGWDAVVAPMLALQPRPSRLPDFAGIQSVLVTSASALPSLPADYHRVPLFAVGDATAGAARQRGFAMVSSASADAAALARLVAQSCRPDVGPLLLASGVGQGAALTEALRASGFRVHRRAVYEARPLTRLPAVAQRALDAGTLRAALFFSPATARAFARAVSLEGSCNRLETVEALVISGTTKAAISPLPWRRIRVASHPNQEELLALLP